MSNQRTWINHGVPEKCEHERGSCAECPFAADCRLTGKETGKESGKPS